MQITHSEKKKKRMKNVAFGVVGANIYWALSA